MPTLRAVNVVTSARGALAQARVPVEIREAISEIFNGRFELDDLKEGDTVRVLYESHYFRGQEVSTGNIMALEVGKSGRLYQPIILTARRQHGRVLRPPWQGLEQR